MSKPVAGAAALRTVGTAPGNVVALDSAAKLPAVDGSRLTGIGSSGLLRRALLAHYRIDEGTGTTLASDAASSASPNDSLLTLQGGATLAPAGMTNASTGAGGATGTLPAALTLTKMSIYWVGQSPVGVNHGQGGLLYGDYSSNNFGLKFFYDGTTVPFTWATFAYGNQQAIAQLVRLDDALTHVWAGVYDGACVRIYCDGALVGYFEATVSSVSVSAINLGCFFSDGSYGFQGNTAAAMLYGIDHSPAQVRVQTAALQQFAAAKGVGTVPLSRLLCAEGDSITHGTNVPVPWFQMVATGLTPTTPAVNFAVPSATISNGLTIGPNANNNLVYRAKYVDAAFGGAPPHGVLAVAAGHNDAGYLSPAASYASCRVYCLARKAAGAKKILICSLLPSNVTVVGGVTGATDFNSWRNLWNALLYADVAAGGVYDGLIDFAADPTIGPDSAGTNTTYFPDGVHPSTAGHVIMAAIAQPVLAAALIA